MKKITLLLALLISSIGFSQTTLYQENFETQTNGTNYTTSIQEFSDGSNDYFTRTDGSDIASNVEINNIEGSFFFGAQDIDGEGATLPATLTTAQIDVSGLSNLDLVVLLAEDADGSNLDWDDSDYVHFTYTLDGGAPQNLLWVESTESGSNNEAAIDTDFDGIGDGDILSDVLIEFNASFDVSGASNLEIQVEFQLNSGDEDIAMDNLRVVDGFSGTGTPSLVVLGSDVTGLSYFKGNFDATTAEGAFTVQGLNLTDDAVITAPTDFEVSLTSEGSFSNSVTIPENSGTIAETDVYIRLASGLSTGNYTGDVNVVSSGLTETVAVTGEVKAATPQLTVSTASISGLNYTVSEGPSEEESFTVEGQFLTDDILVTAPPSYEVSLSSGSGFASSVNISPSSGSVSSTSVYVRLAAGLAENTYTEDVEVSTNGATTQDVAAEGTVFGELTSDMLISGVFDGTLSGGTPKVIELYVINDIADLSAYGFGSANNGDGSDGQELSFSGSATAGDYIYIASESENFNTYFGFNPDYEDFAAAINGDDAVELFQNGQVIDTFGDINTDGTGEDWDYKDGWAYRKNNTGPDGSNFVISNWTFSGVGANNDETDNSSATTPFPIGAFETTMDVNSFGASNLKLYPNPVSNGVLSIETQSSAAAEVEFFNMLGQKVLAAKASKHINVSSLSAGIYLVRVQEGASSQTKKIVIK